MATGCLGWDTASDVAPSSRTTALPAIRRKNTIDPDMDAEDYATRRSCDGAMRGGEGESDLPPLNRSRSRVRISGGRRRRDAHEAIQHGTDCQ